jgi:hypothetical protein
MEVYNQISSGSQSLPHLFDRDPHVPLIVSGKVSSQALLPVMSFTEQVFGKAVKFMVWLSVLRQARFEFVAPQPSGSKRASRGEETSVTSSFHDPKLIVPTGNAVTTGIQTVDGHPWPASRTVIGDLTEKGWTSWKAGGDQDRNRVSAPSDHLQHNPTDNAHLRTHHLSSRQD